MHLEESRLFATPTRFFALALAVRLCALPLSVFGINPYSQHDAVRFEKYAKLISTGEVIPTQIDNAYHTWSGIISVFWHLPGPSDIYARLFVAVLGSLAIYNVAVVAWHVHSHRAAVYASLPLVFFPSFILIHASLLREAYVLFWVTTVARVVLAPSERLSRAGQVGIVALGIVGASIVRPENVAVFLPTLAIGVAGYYAVQVGVAKRLTAVSLTAVVLALPFLLDAIQWVISNRLASRRVARAYGNAVYLPDVIPETVLEVTAFSWVGAAYFYFAPFPWMIDMPSDLVTSFEGLTNIAFAVLAVAGARHFGSRNLPATVALVLAFALFSVLYGVVTGNYGTAIRQRQMFIWVVYLLGGVGFAEYLQIRY